MRTTPTCRAVLFDCDGVLVDSEGLSKHLMVEMMREIGVHRDPGEVLAEFSGRRMTDCMADVERWLGGPLPDDFTGQFRRREYALLAAEVTAVPGIDTALAALDAAALPRAVASNGPMEKIHTTLNATGLLTGFGEHVYSAYQVGSFKPQPGLYLHAAERLQTAPGDCVVVEDSLLGARAGVAAGMRVLAYTSAERAAALAAIGAEPFFDMRRLPELLRG